MGTKTVVRPSREKICTALARFSIPKQWMCQGLCPGGTVRYVAIRRGEALIKLALIGLKPQAWVQRVTPPHFGRSGRALPIGKPHNSKSGS